MEAGLSQPVRQDTSDPATEPLTSEERRSLTHGDFWIPGPERAVYRRALTALNRAGVPYVVSGLYAIHAYTGVYRRTKDLDLFFRPEVLLDAARVLRDEGFRLEIEDAHWLAKAFQDDRLIDLIYGMGNGLALIDEAWYRHSRSGILAATPVRIAPAEELLWHRLYVSERHRHDMADVLHLLLCRGDTLDWDRLLARVGDDFRLLLAYVHLFDYAYPGHPERIPASVRSQLNRRLEEWSGPGDPELCRGTVISRFSFAIDVNEWGFRDARSATVDAAREQPVIRRIIESDVWNE